MKWMQQNCRTYTKNMCWELLKILHTLGAYEDCCIILLIHETTLVNDMDEVQKHDMYQNSLSESNLHIHGEKIWKQSLNKLYFSADNIVCKKTNNWSYVLNM